MTILIATSTAISIGLLVYLVFEAVPARSAAVKNRMVQMGLDALAAQDQARQKALGRSKLRKLLQHMGRELEDRKEDWSQVRRMLVHAGYRQPSALPIYLGVRFLATVVLTLYGVFLGSAADVSGSFTLLCGLLGAGTGWIVPRFLVSVRGTRRKKEIQKALPDAADLLVICVEAGLGLGQALIRVAEELRHQSELLTEELTLTNLAIRAGQPRDQALMELAQRTGVEDMRSLATMLIQTERFGTSIARSLRVYAESLRTRRRQRAEEAAAKTTIKMIFPLALCIFPALFVVILGPACISILQTLGSV